MPDINKIKIVPYSHIQMYELVNNIAAYPEFVPWCTKALILEKTEDEIRACLTFARGGMEKSFTTLNRLQKHRMMEIRLVDGPFKQLEGFWRFEDLSENRSRVSLDLEFEFSNRLIAMMFGPVFHQVASMLVDAFCQRAKEVYR